ncbi:hypothetical protein D3C81_08580 [compost metagenome]
MTRFEVIQKEINKGMPISEKSGNVLRDWTPNNVRRLVIGSDFIIVQYFVVVGKFKKLIEVVNTSKYNNYTQVNKINPSEYKKSGIKAILSVLVEDRVCSSVEEIVFCTSGYEHSILQYDSNIAILGNENTIKTRFPRLRSISWINTTVKEAHSCLVSLGDDLVKNRLKDKGYTVKELLTGNEDNWWKSMPLRGQWYELDKENSRLYTFMLNLKTEHEEMERKDKLASLDEKRSLADLQESLPLIKEAYTKRQELLGLYDTLFSTLGIIAKAEWGKVLQTSYSTSLVGSILKGNNDLLVDIRKIDFKAIAEVGRKHNLDVEFLVDFEDELFNKLLKGLCQYSKENKGDIKYGLKTLKKLAVTLVNAECNIAYLALGLFLSKNSMKFVGFEYDKIKYKLPCIVYTQEISSFCNNYLGDLSVGDIFSKADGKLVTTSEFNLTQKYKEAKAIITALREEG